MQWCITSRERVKTHVLPHTYAQYFTLLTLAQDEERGLQLLRVNFRVEPGEYFRL